MAFVLAERVLETSSTTGTADFALDGAPLGYQSFSAVMSNGDTSWYAIELASTGEWEVGTCTFNAGVMQRTSVLASSVGGAKVAFSAGEKKVAITPPAVMIKRLQDLSAVALSGAYADLSGRPTLATVATTGAYSDLTGKPTLGTAASRNAGLGANQVLLLDGTGKVDASVLPAVGISDTFEVASQAAMLALDAQRGDIAIRTDENKTYVLATDSPTTLADWKWMRTPTDLVLSVAGLTGTISASALKTALAYTVASITDMSANGRSLVTAADYAAMRTLLNVENGAQVVTASRVRDGIAASQTMEFGKDSGSDNHLFIDFHPAAASAPSDYRARIIRYAGVNGNFAFEQTGTGSFDISNGSGALNFTGGTTLQFSSPLTTFYGANGSRFLHGTINTQVRLHDYGWTTGAVRYQLALEASAFMSMFSFDSSGNYIDYVYTLDGANRTFKANRLKFERALPIGAVDPYATTLDCGFFDNPGTLTAGPAAAISQYCYVEKLKHNNPGNNYAKLLFSTLVAGRPRQWAAWYLNSSAIEYEYQFRQPNVGAMASASTLTPDSDTDIAKCNALATNTTIAAPTGTTTKADGQGLTIKIKASGASRNLSWNAAYRPIGVTLPASLASGKVLYARCLWNADDNVWDVLGVQVQA